MSRIVCHFSCGAASAVAAKLMLDEQRQNVVIVNAFVQEEHEDNRRFLRDCESWFNHPIIILRDTKFNASTHEVWKKERFMMSRLGAPCSRALKGKLLDAFRVPTDIDVIGYTKGEETRLERYFNRLSHTSPRAPLIERGLTKKDCFRIVQEAGVRLPLMYELGYNNANCIGCVKGGQGYWDKIRRDFPAKFAEICDIQESLGSGANFLRHTKGPLKGQRMALRELPLGAGRYLEEPPMSCGFSCEATESEVTS